MTEDEDDDAYEEFKRKRDESGKRGVRKKRKEWIGKRAAYWIFYRVLARISDLDIPLDSGDFCLMDRSVIELLDQFGVNKGRSQRRQS